MTDMNGFRVRIERIESGFTKMAVEEFVIEKDYSDVSRLSTAIWLVMQQAVDQMRLGDPELVLRDAWLREVGANLAGACERTIPIPDDVVAALAASLEAEHFPKRLRRDVDGQWTFFP